METVKQKADKAYEALKGEFGYKNKLSAPKLVKVVLGSGTGTAMKKDRTVNDRIVDRLSKITGQRPTVRGAKQSIASFKIRTSDPVGVAVTLRGERMNSFLDKFINVAVPRMKDFRGFDAKAIDNIGNLTLGIKEHTIFPECADEELKDVFGFGLTIVTTAKNKKEAKAFFDHIGIPFKK